jgi:protein involved in polysaccharide export with SLBB domain
MVAFSPSQTKHVILRFAGEHLQRKHLLCLFSAWACLSLFTPLCRAQQAAPQSPQETIAARRVDPTITTTTLIVPGCALLVTVKEETSLTGEYEVDADGAIHFTLSDDEQKHREQWAVNVKQKTAEQAQSLIIVSLKEYLRMPDVHVSLVRMPGLQVEVAGSGSKPGVLHLPLGAHLSDILLACKPNADFAHILIVRRLTTPLAKPDNPAPTNAASNPPAGEKVLLEKSLPTRTLTIDFTGYAQGEAGEDPKLQDGDKIYIQMRPPDAPEHVLRTVRVVGEVGREVDVPFAPNMTIRDALHRAQGVKDTADKNKIRLHRGESGHDYDLKLAGIEADDAEMNMKLVPGDYIVVPKTDLSMRWGIDGEVNARNVFPYNPGEKLTVSKAIARAGGMTKKGDPRKGVLRKGYLVNPTQSHDIIFDYDAIVKHKQTDWEVEKGDVVLVLPRPHRPTVWQQILPLALRFLPIPF